MKEIKKDTLTVKIFDTRNEMGEAAGSAAAQKIREIIAEKGEVNMIFAAAPSQNETLNTLVNSKDIDWGKVNAFHMDEYVGIDKTAPQGFAMFLRNALFFKIFMLRYIYK